MVEFFGYRVYSQFGGVDHKVLEKVQTFQQKDGDLFFEAWEHFNELLLKCPHHNLSQHD
jgi:hypothetical protein